MDKSFAEAAAHPRTLPASALPVPKDERGKYGDMQIEKILRLARSHRIERPAIPRLRRVVSI
jgi:hypothetical protein